MVSFVSWNKLIEPSYILFHVPLWFKVMFFFKITYERRNNLSETVFRFERKKYSGRMASCFSGFWVVKWNQVVKNYFLFPLSLNLCSLWRRFVAIEINPCFNSHGKLVFRFILNCTYKRHSCMSYALKAKFLEKTKVIKESFLSNEKFYQHSIRPARYKHKLTRRLLT